MSGTDVVLNDIRSALSSKVERIPVSPLYLLGLLIVTVAMILLPLIYISLIGAAGYCVYYHAVNHTAILTSVRGRAWILALIVYAGPLVAGAIMVLFMIKPLFARQARPPAPVSLDEKDEPLVFELVRLICGAVGAPVPSRIDVDTQVNASASFSGGMFSVLTGKLVLTIGLPLVAGLSLRNLVGILGHEFGHFSQGAAMRLTGEAGNPTASVNRAIRKRFKATPRRSDLHPPSSRCGSIRDRRQ